MTDMQWEQEQIDAVMSVLLQSMCDFAIETTDVPDTCEEISSAFPHTDTEDPKMCSPASSETKPSLGGDLSIPVRSTIGSPSTPSACTTHPFSGVIPEESVALSNAVSNNVVNALPPPLFPTVRSITINMEIDTPSIPSDPTATHSVPIDMIDMAEDRQPTIACTPSLPSLPDAYMAPPTADVTAATSLPEARHPATDMNVDASSGLHTLPLYHYRSQPPLLPPSEPPAIFLMDVDHESIDDGDFPDPCTQSFDSAMFGLCAAMKALNIVADSKSEPVYPADPPMDLSEPTEDETQTTVADDHTQAAVTANEAGVPQATDLGHHDRAESTEIHVASRNTGPPLAQPSKTVADKAPCALNTAPTSAPPTRAPSTAKPITPPLTKSAFRLQSLIKAALAGRLQEMVPKKLQLESVTDFYWDLAKHFSSAGHPLRRPHGSDVERIFTASEMAFELLDRNGLAYTPSGWQLREVQPSTVPSVPNTPTPPPSTLASHTGPACTERASRKPVIRVKTDESLEKLRSSYDATSPPPSSLPDLTTSSDSDSDGSFEGAPSPSRHTEQRSNGPPVKKEIHDPVDRHQWQAVNYN